MTEQTSIATGKCLICSTPNESIHFGIDSCRACTAFFKRACLSGRRIPCRRGDRKCPVFREEGTMCRGCRYDRCAALGMTYDGPMRNMKDKVIEATDTPTSSSAETLMQRIAREHTACIARRRVRELELVRSHKLNRVPHPTEELYMATYDSAVATFSVTVTESYQFFLAVFPWIAELSYEDQRELFRVCCPQFAMIDCFCRTKRIWGGFRNHSMCSVLLVTDVRNPELWIGAHEGGTMRKERLEWIRAYIDAQLTMMVPAFEQAEICETEKFALLALLLCESDLRSDLAERFQPFLDEIRTQTLEGLQHFYTEEMGLTEYSTRLGKLFTLCTTFSEGNILFQDFIRMQITIFDAFMVEQRLIELLI